MVGAYAAVKFLGSKSEEERAHYDWMGYVGNFIGVGALIPYHLQDTGLDVKCIVPAL